MQPISPIVFFLLLSCCLWDVESQNVTPTLAVTNGGKVGIWGQKRMCPKGKAKGFALKIQPKQGYFDDTALNAISLICTSSFATSAVGLFGTWSKPKFCPSGFLTSFALRVPSPDESFDPVGATNIKFKCTDGSELNGDGHDEWGEYGSWSESCKEAGICGIQTRVQKYQGIEDDTGLNDVKFFCCP